MLQNNTFYFNQDDPSLGSQITFSELAVMSETNKHVSLLINQKI